MLPCEGVAMNCDTVWHCSIILQSKKPMRFALQKKRNNIPTPFA
jgi:hypothetical protein